MCLPRPSRPQDLFGGPDGAAFAAAAAVGLNSADDSLPYSTNELNAPEYSTDDFRMFQFKVRRGKPLAGQRPACPALRQCQPVCGSGASTHAVAARGVQRAQLLFVVCRQSWPQTTWAIRHIKSRHKQQKPGADLGSPHLRAAAGHCSPRLPACRPAHTPAPFLLPPLLLLQVARCSKRYVHDWRACPFAHPTENARRRDPRLVKYLPVPCPDYKRGICLRCVLHCSALPSAALV